MNIKVKAFKETSPFHGAVIISRGITGCSIWYPKDQSISWVSEHALSEGDLVDVELTDEIHLKGDIIQGAVAQPLTPLQQKALTVGMNLVEAAAVFEDLEIARRKLERAEGEVAAEEARLTGLTEVAEKILPDLLREAGIAEDVVQKVAGGLMGCGQREDSRG